MTDISRIEIDRRYYDTVYYGQHAERLVRKDRFTRVKVDRVRRLLDPRSGELIVDLGCGVGTMMTLLASSGAAMIGMDFSQESLRVARGWFAREVPHGMFRAFCSDGRAIALRNCSVDGVMAVDFTEHLDDTILFAMANEVYRILKPGGRFVVYTPSPTHLFERLKKRNIFLKEDKSHIGLRSMEQYLSVLSQIGFQVKERYFRPTDIPLFNCVESGLMMLPFIGGLAKRRICIRAVK